MPRSPIGWCSSPRRAYAQADRAFAQTRAQREAGRLSEFELLRAQVARDTLQPEVVRQRALRDVAYLRLKQLLDVPLDTPIQLSAQPRRRRAARRRSGSRRRLAEAEAQTARAVRTAITQAENDVRIAGGRRWPSPARSASRYVALNSNFGVVTYPTAVPTFEDWRTNWTVGASVSLPIFTGGRIKADEVIARAGVDEQKARLSLTRELADARCRQRPRRAAGGPRRLGGQRRHDPAGGARLRDRRAALPRRAVDAARAVRLATAARAGTGEPRRAPRGRCRSSACAMRSCRSCRCRPPALAPARPRRATGSARQAQSQTQLQPPQPKRRAAAPGPRAAPPRRDDRELREHNHDETYGIDRDRGVLSAAALVAGAALASAGCGKTAASESAGENAAPAGVEIGKENVVTVTSAEISVGPIISGELRAEREATVRAEVGGAILQVRARGGPAGEAGHAARAHRGAHCSRTPSSRRSRSSVPPSSALQWAEREAARIDNLVKGGALAERELEVARNQAVAARAQVDDVKSRLTSARKAPGRRHRARADERHRLEAPRQRAATSSARATSSTRSSIRRACGSRRRCRRPSSTRCASARPCVFEVRGYRDQTFDGRIERISPAADPVTRQVPIFVVDPQQVRASGRRPVRRGPRDPRGAQGRWSCR